MIPARHCRIVFMALICAGFPAVFLLTGNLLPMVDVHDRLGHGATYALASMLAVLGWGMPGGAVLCAFLVALGCLIEVLQVALPTGHLAEWGDVAANISGVAVGWLTALALTGLLGRRAASGR